MAKHNDIDDYLDSLDGPILEIGAQLRSILDSTLGDANGTVWHGHPVWMSGTAPLAGFKAHATYVTFMIWHGNPISDPAGRLQSGSRMATAKVRSTTDIDRRAFIGWLHTAHRA